MKRTFYAAAFMFPFILLLVVHSSFAIADEEGDQQSETLRWMLDVFPSSPEWEAWLEESGEVPPDFESLPSVPGLPDALTFQSGHPVETPYAWQSRREEIMRLFHHYVIGSAPESPGNVRAVVLDSRRAPNAVIHELRLEFGPNHAARLHAEMIIPEGNGPFPVFITQDNHRRWAHIAVRRGYIAMVYAGADSRDDTGAFMEVWPEYDWTKLTRRAWAASRCVDYLMTLPNVNKDQIVLTGHSRNGKLSMIGAALDERITAVISSSSGAGGATPYRFFSEAEFGEGIELLTRRFPDWMHPRLRFFSGREDRLPIDHHLLAAVAAPRAFLYTAALNDNVESVWAIEQAYRAALPVYELLGAPDALQILYRSGSHETRAKDIEEYLDWTDHVFGRAAYRSKHRLMYPSYEDWRRYSWETVNPERFPKRGIDDLLVAEDGGVIASAGAWNRKRGEIMQRIAWGLGENPADAGASVGAYGSERAHYSTMLGRSSVGGGVNKEQVNFGDYVAGDLYYPDLPEPPQPEPVEDGEEAQAVEAPKLPAIIWLHPISNSNGYVAGYRVGQHAHIAMAQAGFAVFCFDQLGHGTRLEEATLFYQRYPRWSLLGKSVADTLRAVDACRSFDFIDPNRIYVVGYGMGAKVALHAAAMDSRIAGAVSVAGFTPMRLDGEEKGTGGLARWSKWFPLQPRLAAFIGQEERVPYDYHEVLAGIAPRPALVVQPTVDYHHDNADVKRVVEEARAVYRLLDAEDRLKYLCVDDYNRFSPNMQQATLSALKELIGDM